MNWASVLAVVEQRRGCSAEQLDELASSIRRPVNPEEAAYLARRVGRNPWPSFTREYAAYVPPPNPVDWPWPSQGLPPSYLSFMAWSNGGPMNSQCRVMEFLAADEVRNEMLVWLFTLFAPGLVPFAVKYGPKAWYAFDARRETVDGELPVVYAQSGIYMLAWMPLAPTFTAFCRQTDRKEVDYREWWDDHHSQKDAEPGAAADGGA